MPPAAQRQSRFHEQPTDVHGAFRDARRGDAGPRVAQVPRVGFTAWGESANIVIDQSVVLMMDKFDRLEELVRTEGFDKAHANTYIRSINADARHIGALLVIFKRDFPEAETDNMLANLNSLIIERTQALFGPKSTTMHDISHVHGTRDAIMQGLESSIHIRSIREAISPASLEEIAKLLDKAAIDLDMLDRKLMMIFQIRWGIYSPYREQRRDR